MRGPAEPDQEDLREMLPRKYRVKDFERGERRSAGALAEHHRFDGLKDDQQVQADGHILDVVEIIFHLLARLFHRRTISVVDLRPPGQSGKHNMTHSVVRYLALQPFIEFWTFGTRPHKGHIASQYIPQLRNLVQTGHSQEMTD